MKNSIADITRKCQKLKDEKKTQKKTLKEAQEKGAKFQSMYQDTRREYRQSLAQITSLRGTVDELRGSRKLCNELESQKKTLRSKLDSALAKCKTLRKRKKKKVTELRGRSSETAKAHRG
eukprot:TRINITY_DN6938_c0_g1_i1.p1 TRINITY_DN6938_c0_g1~~TRINITY_DN6938_c0_g1_i1.p1  ORF type:complete len:120 (+),score=44.51 TRINITY_DN6938_c0_g1_i1:150-509(+)